VEASDACWPKSSSNATHSRNPATIVIRRSIGAELLDLCVKILISYLLGSILGSLIVGKLRGGVDIRKLGSGNAGGTNALRTQGPWFALCVMIIDVGKGWFAAAVLPHLTYFSQFYDQAIPPVWTAVACSAAVVAGHVYPVWYGFRGGKGAATLIGVVLGLQPLAAIPLLLVWLLVLTLSGFVGLATMISALAFPLVSLFYFDNRVLTIFGVIMALFVVYTHRANISRMLDGTESRATRIWLLRPR
jgi:glycerol-3-phosphate acyltransferase PlsY